MNSNAESDSANLFTEKVFENWSICDQFISNWSKSKGFGVIKDRVTKEGDNIRQRVYICEHGKKHAFNSNKESSSKKISCLWHVNASCPNANNSDSAIFIKKIVDEHNHDLNIEAVAFRENKRFNEEMIEDIEMRGLGHIKARKSLVRVQIGGNISHRRTRRSAISVEHLP